MTDLEARLAAQDAEATRTLLLAHLDATRARLRGKLRAGMPPAEFGQAMACCDALQSARELLLLHPMPPRRLSHPLYAFLLTATQD